MHSYPSTLHSPPPLVWAVVLSVLLHAAVVVLGSRLAAALPKPARLPDPALRVKLAEPPAAPVLQAPLPQPELLRREDTPARPVEKKKPVPQREIRTLPRAVPAASRASIAIAPGGVQALSGEAARKAGEQIAGSLFYPAEAIERGQEGEVLVLLFLDEAGNALAARVEASSGYALLDAAAVRAARTLRSLPSSAPREALVPVRFRLR